MDTMLATRRVREFQTITREAYANEYSTHIGILATIRERVLNTIAYKALPRWAQSEIRGYETAMREDMRKRLTWVTLEWSGQRYFSWDEIPPEGKAYLRETPPKKIKHDGLQYHIWTRTGVAFNRNNSMLDKEEA